MTDLCGVRTGATQGVMATSRTAALAQTAARPPSIPPIPPPTRLLNDLLNRFNPRRPQPPVYRRTLAEHLDCTPGQVLPAQSWRRRHDTIRLPISA